MGYQMGAHHSQKWNKALRQTAKTTPKYDPDNDQGKGKARGPIKAFKPDRDTMKVFGTRTVEDRQRVYRHTVWDGPKSTTYVLREKMTDAEYDDYVVQRWRELNGRGGMSDQEAREREQEKAMLLGPPVTASEIQIRQQEYIAKKAYEAGRAIGKSAIPVIYDEASQVSAEFFDAQIWQAITEENK
jgi:hypothetical protein